MVDCLTFYEAKDENNKAKILQEALRVLKNGGVFVFMNLFLGERNFKNFQKMTKQPNVKKIESIKVEEIMHIPYLLRSKKIS